MTKLKYLGINAREIKQGALELALSTGDTFECSDRLAGILIQKSPHDFEEVKDFSPGLNKMYNKTTSFKSK